jgi:hypothetical protein
MAGTRLPDEVIENFRSLAGAEASAIQAMRQQAGPSAPEAELTRIATVAAKARPEVVRATADLWNNGHPAERPSGFANPVLILAAHRAARRRGRLDQPLPGQRPRDRSGRKVSRG